MRSMPSRGRVPRLVTPDGRPSMSSSERLLMPENCGRNPRIPMPESTPAYWMTSTPAFFFMTSVRSAATVRSISVASITSTFCGVSVIRVSTLRPVTTTSSEKPPAASTNRRAGSAPVGGTVTCCTAAMNCGSSTVTVYGPSGRRPTLNSPSPFVVVVWRTRPLESAMLTRAPGKTASA